MKIATARSLGLTTSIKRNNFLRLFLFAIITRLVVLTIGCLCPEHAVNLNAVNSPQLYAELNSGWRHWIEHWYRWDADRYIDIALNGYSYNGDSKTYSNVAFMPLLPICIAISKQLGLDPYATGLIVPNLTFSIGLALFGQVITQVTQDAKLAWRSCLLLCAFPTAFFFSAPYEDSLGFLFTVIALYAWFNSKIWGSQLSVWQLPQQHGRLLSLFLSPLY